MKEWLIIKQYVGALSCFIINYILDHNTSNISPSPAVDGYVRENTQKKFLQYFR